MTNKILVCGTYDMLHIGHKNFLNYALGQGDLYLGLSTDDFAMSKGQDIMQNYDMRKKQLQDFGIMNIYAEISMDTKKELIKSFDIDKFIIGEDWIGRFDDLECEVEYRPRTPGISSTQIRTRIMNERRTSSNRLSQ